MTTTKQIKLIFALFFTVMILVFSSCSDNPGDSGPTTRNVNGKLINEKGIPVISATVAIGNTINSVSADGSFSFSNVTFPYDIRIITNGVGTLYKGLNSENPQLYIATGTILAPTNLAHLAVTFPNLGSTEDCRVLFTDGKIVYAEKDFTLGSNGIFDVQWFGASGLTGKVIIYTYEKSSGIVNNYIKYGEKDAILSPGNNIVIIGSVDMRTITKSTISGNVSIPSELTSADDNLFINFSQNYSVDEPSPLRLYEVYGAPTAFTYNVPTGITPAPKSIVFYNAQAADGSSSIKIASMVPGVTGNIVLETPAKLISPVDAGTANYQMTFSYSNASGNGIYMVYFASLTHEFWLFTSETNVAIPDFTSFGLGLEEGEEYEWRVMKYSSVNLDEFVSGPTSYNTKIDAFTKSRYSSFRVRL